MASEVVTYYRQKGEDDEFSVPKLDDGIFRVNSFDQEADESFFLGEIRPGTMLSSLNNNMYGVPLFRHELSSNDFLLVSSRTKKLMYLRDIPALYVVGQIQPKIEVPAPNSRNASKYMKQRLQVYIYRLLKNESKVQISAVAEAFKEQSESAIRAELKEVAEFQRGGVESGWWIKKTGWEPPRDSDLQQTVTPEEVCAYESMLAGKIYLSDLGLDVLKLSQKLTSIVQRMPPDYPLTPYAKYVEQELQLTPWNWTGNFVWAQQGLGFLKLDGPGHPCGKNQGFSYIKSLAKTDVEPSGSRIAPAVSLTGTDKDLRSLPNNELKDILLSFGVSHAVIDATPRWHRVNMVREKATDAVLMGIDTPYARFARSTRNTSRAQRKQFKKDAQRIFNRHCDFLSSTALPQFSDDENYSDDDDWVKGFEDEMEIDESVSPVRRVKFQVDEEQAEYQRLMMEREKTTEVSASSKVPRKRVIKKKILKRTVIIFQEDGNHHEVTSIIDDPEKVNNYMLDLQDGGKRFQDTIEEIVSVPPPPAKKPRKTRTEPKKRRRKKLEEADGSVTVLPEMLIESDITQNMKPTKPEKKEGKEKRKEGKAKKEPKEKKESKEKKEKESKDKEVKEKKEPKEKEVKKEKEPKEKKGQKRKASEALQPSSDEPQPPKPSKKRARKDKESQLVAASTAGGDNGTTNPVFPFSAQSGVVQSLPPTQDFTDGGASSTSAPAKPRKPPKEKTCSACKQLGHSKTSKICPMRGVTQAAPPAPVTTAPTIQPS
eukprot:TRINITY_DN130_c1_g1_i1.p1 TRINITY_DN130_c1_g1~~TRINITY_DN130_c1_g1_i1.p1  ORF type:complete len:794 (+),score=206.57 TRINITY_DN130_c1_g1_i1:81-2384(+)